MKNAVQTTALIALTLAISSTALATQGVSPGATDRIALVNDACPTFSWLLDEDAVEYELVAYSLPEVPAQQVELTPETEALYSSVPAGATSWTPSAEQCLAPGGRYVWFVRAATELIDDQVIEAGEDERCRSRDYVIVSDADRLGDGMIEVAEPVPEVGVLGSSSDSPYECLTHPIGRLANAFCGLLDVESTALDAQRHQKLPSLHKLDWAAAGAKVLLVEPE